MKNLKIVIFCKNSFTLNRLFGQDVHNWLLYRVSGQSYRSMSTVPSRKCVKLVYGFLVLFLVTKCVDSSKKPSNNSPPAKNPSFPATTTTKKPKGYSDSDELLTIIEDQSKLPPPEVHPSNHDPCVLGSAMLYLSWWINENGSLAVPDEIGTNHLYFRHASLCASTEWNRNKSPEEISSMFLCSYRFNLSYSKTLSHRLVLFSVITNTLRQKVI